jgi:glycosyltransferase involved in cell wall biosynthesis
MSTETDLLGLPTAPAGIVAPPVPRGLAQVEIVVPVYNEARGLEASVRRLHAYLGERFPFDWRITIADNGSVDGTAAVADHLATTFPGVAVVHLDQKGRGRALRAVWSATDADVVAYMDVDLSTDLDALLPLVAPLVSGHSHLAIGSRLAPGARVVRGPRREMISRSYNLILRSVLRLGVRDAQCGFKAARADALRTLLPEVQDESWFFDTELLVRAQRSGLRIVELPVDWVDDPDSRVDIVRTALDDLRGVWRLLLHRPTRTRVGESAGPALRPTHSAAVGAVCTLLTILAALALWGLVR